MVFFFCMFWILDFVFVYQPSIVLFFFLAISFHNEHLRIQCSVYFAVVETVGFTHKTKKRSHYLNFTIEQW